MKVFLETYGCQMNEYDSEHIRSILTKANYSFVKSEADADIIMLNTCAIRENAHRKIYGRIYDIRNNRLNGRSKFIERDHPTTDGPLIGILGCMATNLRKNLLENKGLKIDFIAGPDSYKKLPELIAGASEKGEKTFDLTLSEFETYSDIYPLRERGVNAWIAVMRGCNNFCTFCVVPYTRGRERSRSVENVLEEVRRLADEGFKQVTLLGQNVNSYYYDPGPVIASDQRERSNLVFKDRLLRHSSQKTGLAPRNDTIKDNDVIQDFAYLIERVSEVEGIKRIRFTSPHPKDFPDPLLEVVAHNPKVCKNIHLPLQSGNDRILQLMDRIYTVGEYLALVEKIHKLNPAISLTTDIIVGFPTETDSEFADTLNIVRQVEYDSAFTFKYSQRKGTIAEKKFPDDVSDDVKTERIMQLVDVQRAISLKRNQMSIGQTLEILIERDSPKSPDEYQGRTDDNRTVIFPCTPHKIGDFIDVKITGATTSVLKGKAVSQ